MPHWVMCLLRTMMTGMDQTNNSLLLEVKQPDSLRK